jgi:hypothetical protein
MAAKGLANSASTPSPVVLISRPSGEARLNQLPFEPLELGVRAFLVAFHERGITDHVGLDGSVADDSSPVAGGIA